MVVEDGITGCEVQSDLHKDLDSANIALLTLGVAFVSIFALFNLL